MNSWSNDQHDVLFSSSKFHNPVLNLIDKRALVNEAVHGFILNKHYLAKIQKVYEREIALGFCKTPSRPSSLLMAKSMLPYLPDGTEEGDYLSIDLGSTNFRVMLSQFKRNEEAKSRVKHYKVPDNVRQGESRAVFDFMAQSIDDFVNSYDDIKDEELPLGFTFSFPMHQHALNSATLINWTINFNCPDAIGKDAVLLLQQAIDRIPGLKVKVTAILNDVTATLASGHANDKNCVIGFALGSGLNISYVERTKNILNWTENRPEGYEDVEYMDINTELKKKFCALGDSGSLDLIKKFISIHTIEKHPKLASLLIDFTRELAVGNKNIQFKIEQNGAGKGGALCAAIAAKFFDSIKKKRELLNKANSHSNEDKLKCKLVTNHSNISIEANC